ncbi:DUF4349 domain-containing protein [Isoptericola cucumis]|uniref:DUF4349 domain-containing protein n=1 Tax=Isoptericola cucumis TaxID=1776856 RepID=UPI0032089DBA
MSTTARRAGTRRAAPLAWLCALLVLVLAACSGPGAGEDSSASSRAGETSAGAVEDAAGEGADEGAALGEAASEGTATTDDREIITTGHATVVVDDPSAAAAELARLVEQAGGRVERRSESAGGADEPGSASMTFRIPSDRMTSAVEALDGLGDVQDVQQDSVDVTGEAQDLDARIAALNTSTGRLRELMADAASTGDLLEVEQELSERQAELDSLTAQRQRLADQVAMSTLDVELVSEPVAVAQSRGGFLGGLASGWDALVTTLSTLVLVLGVVLPWLALVGVGYLGYRWWRRSRSSQAAGGQGPAGGAGPDDGPGYGPSGDGPDDTAASDDAPDDAPATPVPAGR